jgi:photosystem II stability/assembly factor-like uncharacterized protein
MRKKILICILLTAFAVNAYPQPFTKYFWRQIPSGVNTDLNAFVSRFIVGDNHTLLITTNNGLTFTHYDTSLFIGNFNYSYSLIGSAISTIVGDNGKIFYAQGNTWAQQISGTTVNLNGISYGQYVSSYWRIAVGNNGKILRSTNSSGFNWSEWNTISSPSTNNLNSISVKGFSAWIAGDNGTLLKSTNGGINWFQINAGVSNNLNSVIFLDTITGWITGSNGLIIKSTNGGLNWTVKPSGTASNLKSFLPYYICGSNGTFLYSLDSGNTWKNELTGTAKNINSLYNTDPRYNTFGSIIVGDSGLILRRDIDSSFLFRKLEGNTISTYFFHGGIFNQNGPGSQAPGFEWPINSNKYAIFSSGLSIAAIVNGQLRQAMCSFKGEYTLGYCINGIPHTNDTFKIYSVKRGDSHSSNPDWLYWGLMVPYGAPYVDVNNNNQYEPMIDTPGVKNSSQTIFICLTDGFQSSHNIGEGFGGGTVPLFVETHITAWCYSQPSYNQMQFVKFETINKGLNPWSKTYYSVYCDSEVGDANDDYIGCDTIRKMGFGYNADNDDPIYGLMPPAVGIIFLRSVIQKNSTPPINLGMTSFIKIGKSMDPPCESHPNGEPYPAYLMMKGYKKDSTSFFDISQTPYKRTKICYAGDPETNNGWTEFKGQMTNCGGDTTGSLVIPNAKGDKYFLMSSGSDLNTVLPGDTQTIVICQLIARGNSNLNSVTILKELADVAINFYNTGFIIGIEKIVSEIPTEYGISQNYPNPFNSMTNVKFQMLNEGFAEIKMYDITGRLVKTLTNQRYDAGVYLLKLNAEDLSSGIYFYTFKVNGNIIDTKKLVMIK